MDKQEVEFKYIELVGQPCSGKTTVSEKLRESNVQYPIKFPTLEKRNKLKFLLALPKLLSNKITDIFFITKLFILNTKITKDNFWNYRFFIRATLRYEYDKTYNQAICLPEGTLHYFTLIDFRESVDVQKIYDSYIKRYKNSYDAIVYFNVNKEVVKARAEERIKNRNYSLKKEKLFREKFNRGLEQKKYMEKVLSSTKEIPVIEIDAAQPVQEKVEVIKEVIKSVVEIDDKKELCKILKNKST